MVAFLDEEDGATSIEYALITALLAVAIIATVSAVGGQINGVFKNVASKLTPGTGI